MSEPADVLRARVASLEAENAALRSSPDARTGRTGRRSRAVVAVVLIALGVVLAPVAVVSGWAKWTLTDTERFVAAYAPLAASPQVQGYVVDQTMTAIDERLDVDGLTQQLVDGLIALGTGPRATAALQTLQGSVAEALRTQIRDGVTQVVGSDQFAAIWTDALRTTHTQLMATLGGDPQAVATISADGSLGIPLGPLVDRVKAQLVAQGLTVAERIPPIDRTVVLVQSDQLPRVQLAYGLVIGVGTWLPWVVLALLAGGVLVANRRHRTLVWAAGAFGAVMLLLAAAIAAGRVALVAAVPPGLMPASVSTLFYDAATDAMRATAVATAVLGVAVALVAWFAGPFRAPTTLRGLYGDGVDRVRTAAAGRGLDTGRFGDWVHRTRPLLFGLIALVAAVVVLANRPITVSLVGWTVFWSVLAVIVVTLIERVPAAALAPGGSEPSVDPTADPTASPPVGR